MARRLDGNGSLEGLPLYLIILVVIAAVVLVGLVALVPRAVVPSYMTVKPDTMCWNKPAVVAVTVFSKDDKPIGDALVQLHGASIDFTKKTEAGGKVFAHVTPKTANPNAGSGSVDVVASFGGSSIVNSIPVNPCAPTSVSTREEATAVVMDSVVHPDEYPRMDIFSMEAPLRSGQTVETVWDDATQGPKVLAVVEKEAFLFFVDTAPGDRFEHPVHIALVGVGEGEVTAFQAGWWPAIDGEERWISEESREAPGERVFSKDSSPQPVSRASRGLSVVPTGGTIPSYCRPQDIQRWALAISANDDAAVNPEETDDFAELLTGYGYTTWSLKPSNMPSGWDTVKATFTSIGASMTRAADAGYCDEFFLLWGGHGSEDGWLPLDDSSGRRKWLRSPEIAEVVDRTTELIKGMQVRIVLDFCYSGLHFESFFSVMLPDPNAGEPDKIFRDVYVMTAVNAYQLATGSVRPFEISQTFTMQLHRCITDQQKVDFAVLFGCAKSRYGVKSSMHSNWWNDGT